MTPRRFNCPCCSRCKTPNNPERWPGRDSGASVRGLPSRLETGKLSLGMKQEDALLALRQGNFETAAHLLETVVRDNRYSSDVLNHAYTIALHSSGQTGELADAAFRIGQLYESTNPGLALDYYQRAIYSGLDPDRVRAVCAFQTRLSCPPDTRPSSGIRIGHIAHVIGCFLPGHAPSLYVQLMAQAMADHGIRSSVFTTEWASDWFFNPPGRQSQPIEVEAETVVGPEEGNFLARAKSVAAAIRDRDIDIAFYHCGPTEQITVRVATLRPTPIQINVNHATEVDADIFDGFAHLFQNGMERSRFRHRPSRWIPLISDIEERLESCLHHTPDEFEMAGAETVSGTYGNLFKVSPAYVRTLIRILARFPAHYHLFAGAGDSAPIQKPLHAAGLMSRVRFLGHVDDIAGLLNMTDVYLNTFPVSGGQSVLEPMAAATPVVILRHPEATHFNAGAELAGMEEVSANDEVEYVELAARLIAEPELRRQYGRRLQERFRSNFRPTDLARIDHEMDQKRPPCLA